jgi:hypothetical protein
MMKKSVITIVLSLVIIGFVFAEGPILAVVNDTGYDILYFYISRAASNDWEEDVLGENILPNGELFRVLLPAAGVWDLKAVDEEEDSYTLYNVSIQEDMRIVITLEYLDSH